MKPHQRVIWFVYDDRERVSPEVRSLVGPRRYGDIVIRRTSLFAQWRATVPAWAQAQVRRLQSAEDVLQLRQALEASAADSAVCVIAARAGMAAVPRMRQLYERLPYAEEDFADQIYNPLLVFWHDAHALVRDWQALADEPVHHWQRAWQQAQRVEDTGLVDLSRLPDFLSYSCGATAARHFNEMQFDAYFYTKRSADKRKMRAEYAFHTMVPESMRPWLVQPFDYRDEGSHASYRMLRYYLADAALQWVHGAFTPESFGPFVARLLYFVLQRPVRPCAPAHTLETADALFLDKVRARVRQFLKMPEGQRIDQLVRSSAARLGIEAQVERYAALYARHRKAFAAVGQVVGHGDPCFSNVLYDQQRYLLTLIDPKGAEDVEGLWTHPLYDVCKISHSVLGDYDFINNGFFRVGFDDANAMQLELQQGAIAPLKQEFVRQLGAAGFDYRAVRLGEASLFLSMLPLHIDVPNKVVAFMLKADAILDKVERA